MPENTEVRPAPVLAAERIDGLDVVRGFALLGILLMNICSFGMPMAAEGNPSAYGGTTGANYWFWWTQYVFWSGKMRALFSMCFGAGVIYLTSRAESRGASAGDVYYRRTLWLLAFGVVHGYLIWYGDILYPYALMGLLLYPLRALKPWVLIAAGAGMIVALSVQTHNQAREMIANKEKLKPVPAHAVLDSANAGLRSSYKGMEKDWLPPKEKIDEEIRIYQRGTYAEAFGHRVSTVQGWTSQSLISPGWWDILSMMLLGMAFARQGLFAGVWSAGRYLLIGAVSLAVGGGIGAVAANHVAANGFSAMAAMQGWSAYQVIRFFVAFGYLCLLTGAVRARLFRPVTEALGAVGRMAFSNYIMHSIVCAILFYSFGFALFGKLERHQLYYAVLAIWVVQMIASPIWLRHFQYGPLEWCWRSLTYWKRQPMRVTSGRSLLEENPA